MGNQGLWVSARSAAPSLFPTAKGLGCQITLDLNGGCARSVGLGVGRSSAARAWSVSGPGPIVVMFGPQTDYGRSKVRP